METDKVHKGLHDDLKPRATNKRALMTRDYKGIRRNEKFPPTKLKLKKSHPLGKFLEQMPKCYTCRQGNLHQVLHDDTLPLGETRANQGMGLTRPVPQEVNTLQDQKPLSNDKTELHQFMGELLT